MYRHPPSLIPTQSGSRVKSLLLFHCIEGAFIRRLHDVDLGNEYLNRSIKALVDLFDYLSAEKKRLTHEVVELSRKKTCPKGKAAQDHTWYW
jgi:hypothetical protein